LSRTARLEARLGHPVRRGELLEQALTHRSYGTPHKERLEFLGDGVLGCVVAEALLARFPQLSEGELSRMRASLVRQEALAAAAAGLGLAEYLRMGQGESIAGGAHRPSILADALEALFGAVFLDGGYDKARAAVLAALAAALDAADEQTTAKDPKTRLQEVLQARRHGLPRYQVVATRGAAHEQVFEVQCSIEALDLHARGSGASRRAAEQQAAQALLSRLEA
jgi:ribonuclease-3